MASVVPGGQETSEGRESGKGGWSGMDTKGHGEGSCLGKRERTCSQPVGQGEPKAGTLGVAGPRKEEQWRLNLWARRGCVAATGDSQRRGAFPRGRFEWLRVDEFPHVGGKRLLCSSRIRNKNSEKNF